MKSNSPKKKNKYLLPIGLALVGVAAAVAITVFLLQQQDDAEQERDVENYDVKNVPLL